MINNMKRNIYNTFIVGLKIDRENFDKFDEWLLILPTNLQPIYQNYIHQLGLLFLAPCGTKSKRNQNFNCMV